MIPKNQSRTIRYRQLALAEPDKAAISTIARQRAPRTELPSGQTTEIIGYWASSRWTQSGPVGASG
jgi:hypothetical protein